ncbi:TPA: restriction endonuclease subunit S [Vibrio parahaemolyticus]|nr:restriction endonuclease subunit S [Vibrio parahaemolyticus]HCG9000427.1 restriction endonuclease subunit S [Vibrio parahaemolyticus]
MGNISTYESYVFNSYFGIELPEHWDEKRLGYLASNEKNAFVDGPFGSDLKTNDYKEDGIPLIQLNNIRDGKHVLRNFKYVTEQKKNELSRHIARPRDIVLAKMAEPVARSAIVSGQFDEYVIVADCVKMTPDSQKIDLNFLNWAINSEVVKTQAELVSTGTTRIRISLGELKKLKVPYPSHGEQTQIANFLDHETAKIDTLIEKQQQLIKLLKEKRQAVISHAVTKGLYPEAPMKDSGVEWLGEVPEHWVVSKFAFLKKVLTDYTANGSFADLKANVQYLDEPSFARLVRLTDLRKDLQNDNGVWVDEKSYKYLKKSALFGGEFLLANVGAYAGLFYQMPFEKGPASLAPNMFMAKFDDSKVSREFMAYVGQSSPVASQLRLSATASSAQPKLNKDDFKSVSFCYPTLREQNEIVEHLNQEVRKIEQLLTKQERAIALMQERRTALISAAVTGKIDVRNWQAPTSQDQALEQTS